MLLTEKYKPNSLDKIAGQEFVKLYLSNSLKSGKIINLTFAGKPGIGKSATINAYIHDLYYKYTKLKEPKSLSILEINASDENSVYDNNAIKEFVNTQTFDKDFPYKFIILEEADNMSKAKQYALRRIIETSGKNVIYFITCNYIGNIIPAILSRCPPCIFHKVSDNELKKLLNEIIEKEQIKLINMSINDILAYCDGDCRKAINLLEIIKNNNCVNLKDLLHIVSNNELDELVESILFDETINLDYYFSNLSVTSIGNFFKQLLLKFLEQPIDANKIMKVPMIIQKYDYKVINNNEYKLQAEACIYELIELFRGDKIE